MTRERIEIAYKFMPRSAKKVLDIGAGYGYIERLLSKNRSMEIFGNDISKNAVKNFRKDLKVILELESIYEMQL